MDSPAQDPRPDSPFAEVLEDLVRSVRTTVDLQRQMFTGRATSADMGAAYVRFLRDELLPYGRRVADLTADYYRSLTEAARDYGAAFYDEVLSAGEEDSHPSISLTGPAGSDAQTTFALENHDPVPADVSLEAGLCRGPSGEAFAAPLSVQPEVLTIPSGETATVTLRAELTPEIFSPGVSYRLPLHVRGPRPATLDVTIEAEPGGRSHM